MPLPSKVDIFHAQICRDQEMRTYRNLQYGTVIPNAPYHSRFRGLGGSPPDKFD